MTDSPIPDEAGITSTSEVAGSDQIQGLPTGTFNRLVIGIDFSPSSLYALQLVRTHFSNVQRLLVHVTDIRVSATPDLMGGLNPTSFDPTLLHALESSDTHRLEALAQDSEATEVLVGDPVTGILDAASRWQAELIVVGTHSQGAIEHFFMGSTAEKVVMRSAVPVLTVCLPKVGKGEGSKRSL